MLIELYILSSGALDSSDFLLTYRIVSYNITRIHNLHTNIHLKNNNIIITITLQGLVLVPALHDKVPNLPIICAGGIADGRGLAAMLALGADGVAMGSRLATTMEVSRTLKGLFLYNVGILCNMEWCVRWLYCSSTIFYIITSISYNHHTNNNPTLNI